MKILLPKRFEVEDIKRWTKAAKKEGRSLNNWMDYILNQACPKKVREKIKDEKRISSRNKRTNPFVKCRCG